VRRAIEFIHDQLGEDFSLSDLAAIAGLSTFHFARVFKQTVGIPPYQYVIQQRIETAKQLMLSTRRPLSEVALKVGFYDHAHFARHFKRLTGLTAKEFLKKIRTGI
jgi:AraC family transcriptional regulator